MYDWIHIGPRNQRPGHPKPQQWRACVPVCLRACSRKSVFRSGIKRMKGNAKTSPQKKAGRARGDAMRHLVVPHRGTGAFTPVQALKPGLQMRHAYVSRSVGQSIIMARLGPACRQLQLRSGPRRQGLQRSLSPGRVCTKSARLELCNVR